MSRTVHKTNGRIRTKCVRVYPFPYLVLTEQGYTKHYYAGADRVCARLGSGGLDHDTSCISRNEEVSTRVESLFWYGLKLVDAKEFKPESLKELQLVDIHGKELDWLIEKLLMRLRISVKPDSWSIHKIIDDLVRERPDEESDVFFYHSDHLGSASWITDGGGAPVQHLQYLPFGEPFVDQHPAGYQERFRFTGKERDEETGYGYFGARYMDHELMTMWLSVDPMADKYPSISPYNYCMWNPLRVVDPDGKDGWDVIAGYCIGFVTNIVPGSGLLRDAYNPSNSEDYNNALRAADNATVFMGYTMAATGTAGSAAGAAMVTSGGAVSLSIVGAPEGVLTATAGAVVIGTSVVVAGAGTSVAVQATANASQGYNRGEKNRTSKTDK